MINKWKFSLPLLRQLLTSEPNQGKYETKEQHLKHKLRHLEGFRLLKEHHSRLCVGISRYVRGFWRMPSVICEISCLLSCSVPPIHDQKAKKFIWQSCPPWWFRAAWCLVTTPKPIWRLCKNLPFVGTRGQLPKTARTSDVDWTSDDSCYVRR